MNNIKKIKKEWRKYIKEEDFSDYLCFYRVIKNSAQSMMLQMVDFLFSDGIYSAFLELVELNDIITIMLESKSYETIDLCKERVDFLLTKKIENWYI